MARPVPIVVPGPSGFGLDQKQVQTNINLGPALQLLDRFLFKPKRDKAASEAIQKLLPTEEVPGLSSELARSLNLPTGHDPTKPTEKPFLSIEQIANIAKTPLGVSILKTLATQSIKQRFPEKEIPKVSELGLTKDVLVELQKDPTVNIKIPETITPAKIQTAQDTIDKRKLSVSERQGMQAIQTQIDARPNIPIPTTELINIRHPDTFATFPVGSTYKDVQAQGAVTATPTQVAKVFDLDSTSFIIDQIDTLTTQLITAETPAEAARQGLGLSLAAFARTNPQATAYIASKQAFLGNLARTQGGERGVLTDRDIGRIDKVLPALRDTKQVRDLKMLSIRGLNIVSKEAAKAKILGRKPDAKSRATINKILGAMESGNAKQMQSVLKELKGLGVSQSKLSTEDRVRQIMKQNPNIGEATAIEQALDEESK